MSAKVAVLLKSDPLTVNAVSARLATVSPVPAAQQSQNDAVEDGVVEVKKALRKIDFSAFCDCV